MTFPGAYRFVEDHLPTRKSQRSGPQRPRKRESPTDPEPLPRHVEAVRRVDDFSAVQAAMYRVAAIGGQL
jgi:hypothetical protein